MHCGDDIRAAPVYGVPPGPNPTPLGNPQVPCKPGSVFRHWPLRAGQKNEDSRSRGRRRQATLRDARETDSSKNIFRVGAARLKEPASVESTVLTNGSSV